LHLYVAFDWGEEVDLEKARRLVPAEVHDLPRRRRTPTSITYRPPPLRFALSPVPLTLPELGPAQAAAEATVFDFGAVSIAMHVPFRLAAAALGQVAASLAHSAPVVQSGRLALQPLFQCLLPALMQPAWADDLSEEYFVFHLTPCEALALPGRLLEQQGAWLAGLVRLESGSLSSPEIEEALRLHLSYSPEDLVIPDWAAAVLIDCDCDETLQAIEFANLQLLEFRHIDNRLDDSLAAANRLISPLRRWSLPLLRGHGRSLRALGSLKVEFTGLFERAENALKLVGDQYLARVYQLLARRFHLDEWEQAIQRKLEAGEGVYQVLSDQAASYRTEFLELVVIVLILVEILLAIFRH
jgi:hypothetical protein